MFLHIFSLFWRAWTSVVQSAHNPLVDGMSGCCNTWCTYWALLCQSFQRMTDTASLYSMFQYLFPITDQSVHCIALWRDNVSTRRNVYVVSGAGLRGGGREGGGGSQSPSHKKTLKKRRCSDSLLLGTMLYSWTVHFNLPEVATD